MGDAGDVSTPRTSASVAGSTTTSEARSSSTDPESAATAYLSSSSITTTSDGKPRPKDPNSLIAAYIDESWTTTRTSEEQPKSKDPKALTAAYLEKSLHLMVEAMNKREFSSTIFNLCSDDFQAITETDTGIITLDLEGHLNALRAICKQFPNVRDTPVDVSVSVIDGGNAEVFLHGETRGCPEGIVRQNLGVMEWRRVRRRKKKEGERDGDEVEPEGYEWKCVKYRGIRGMAGPDMMGGNRNAVENLAD